MRPIDAFDHVQSSRHYEVTLLAYLDYQCPYCAHADQVVRRVRRYLGDRLRYVVRNFPIIAVHPLARIAAEVAEAAGAQRKFWEMYGLLFEHQRRLGLALFLELAQRLELERDRFFEDLENAVYRPRIRLDIADGMQSGVNGTPCFFIDGVRHDGAWDVDALRTALEAPSAHARR
ncbi:MAG: thioredoxin domain-containing protein [Kofleriaceae bacterium]|nr:thioredoxin domain-containing protein [Kofleriaceae bacterium]